VAMGRRRLDILEMLGKRMGFGGSQGLERAGVLIGRWGW